MVRVTKETTTIVKPAVETPRHAVWLSNLDLMASNSPVPVVYLYRTGTPKSTFPAVASAVREALAKILVPYYPLAGRFGLGPGARIEIDCCAEGAEFTVAEADRATDDLGDFTPTAQLRELAPVVDRSGGISSFPLLAVQITSFKCGAMSLGLSMEHRVCDGTSAVKFINDWSKLARDLNQTLTPPLIDRTFLQARNPPRPKFDHYVEYQPTILLNNAPNGHNNDNAIIAVKTFKLEEQHIFALKAKAILGDNDEKTSSYSTHEIVVGHIWKCACMARGSLSLDAETKLYIATSGRSRLTSPPCPSEFFGNVIFATSPVAVVGDIVSKPTLYAVDKIRGALAKMKDEEYLRSAVDFLEGLNPSLSERGGRGSVVYKSPNLGINSWVRMPLYEADFGWGRPFYVGPVEISCEGKAYLLPDSDDKDMFLVMALNPEDMARFEKLVYEIC